MKGGIYSDQRCPVCGGRFVNNHTTALICPNHPKVRANSYKVVFGKLTKRFRTYEAAFSFLSGIRFKTDEHTFDLRDYKRDNPLSFTNLSTKWLSYKKDEIKPFSYRSIRNHMDKAQEHFGNMNVKDIR